ncbi:hypothetical protein LXL04_015259 [Taraxacum kok-saghyz]
MVQYRRLTPLLLNYSYEPPLFESFGTVSTLIMSIATTIHWIVGIFFQSMLQEATITPGFSISNLLSWKRITVEALIGSGCSSNNCYVDSLNFVISIQPVSVDVCLEVKEI